MVRSLSFGCSQCYEISVSRAVHPEEKVFGWGARLPVLSPACLLLYCRALCSWGPQDAPVDLRRGYRFWKAVGLLRAAFF